MDRTNVILSIVVLALAGSVSYAYIQDRQHNSLVGTLVSNVLGEVRTQPRLTAKEKDVLLEGIFTGVSLGSRFGIDLSKSDARRVPSRADDNETGYSACQDWRRDMCQATRDTYQFHQRRCERGNNDSCGSAQHEWENFRFLQCDSSCGFGL